MRLVHARRARRAAFASVLLTAVAAGCGSPSSHSATKRSPSAELTSTLRAVDGLPLAARDAKLLALAKKDGARFSLYTTLNPSVLGPLTKAFEKRYGIHVDAFTTDPPSLVQRVEQETRAGHRQVDGVETGGPELIQLRKEGDLIAFRSPLQAKLGRGAVQRDWTTTRYSDFVVGWNTKHVQTGQQPKSWEELARPKWKGRLSLSPDTTGVSLYLALSDYWRRTKGRSQAASDRIFEGIARNARIVPQFAVNAQLLASGEVDVAAGSVASNNVDKLRLGGAPVAWRPPVTPIIRQRQGAALVRDAPHPAAALLFFDFEMGPGQRILAADHRNPARVDLAAGIGRHAAFVDLDALAARQPELARRWEQIVRLGQK